MISTRSAYHNVPLINGYEQKDGRQYKATDVSHAYNDKLSSLRLSIASAYPKEAAVGKWEREIALNREKKRVEITEIFDTKAPAEKASSEKASSEKASSEKASSEKTFSADKSTEMVLMCYGEPRKGGKGRILLQEGHVVLHYPAKALTASWEKVRMNDGIMKEQWHDNVYRIRFSVNKGTNGKISYYFKSKK